MATLAQIKERNRRHGGSPYLLFLEVALPNGKFIRAARDPQSWVWPLAGATVQQLDAPGAAAVFVLAAAGAVTFSVGDGEPAGWSGTVLLQRNNGTDAAPDWFTVSTIAGREEDQLLSQPAATYRLLAGPDFAGSVRAILGDGSCKLWQAMNFTQEVWKEGEGARAGSLTLTIFNTGGVPQQYVEELEDWRKANGRVPCDVALFVVNTGLLDDPEPTKSMTFIDRAVSIPAPGTHVHITLGVPMTFDRLSPRGILMRDYCRWQRPDQCQYVAQCNHTISGCKFVTQTLDPTRIQYFGGFPFMGGGALYGS